MLFNSLQFLIFFPAVVILYWVAPRNLRNPLLLVAGFYFYMNWQPAFGLLLAAASAIAWCGGLLISSAPTPKIAKRRLIASIGIILVMLFTFKYLTFFADQVRLLLFRLGVGMKIPEFTILLPVGISFFTFQAIGYLIDVKRGEIRAERNLLTVTLFLSYFPQLVAGPIERAKSLLPQFKTAHTFSTRHLIAGAEMMILGYFMKLCIADKVAVYVDMVYARPEIHNGTTLLFATFLFCFQIFADFGGYSLIAIGAARCMGFRLTRNFRQPYLATSMRDFWRRWHISLSRWLQDYIYIPLGGNRVKPRRHYFNIFFTLLLSGIWHGADYTFVAWGAYHGSLQTLQAAWHKKSKFHLPQNFASVCLKIVWVFILVMMGRVFFRASSLGDASVIFRKIATEQGAVFIPDKMQMAEMLVMIIVLMIIEVRHEFLDRRAILAGDTSEIPAARSARSLTRSAVVAASLLLLIVLFGVLDNSPFIYFQF